MTGNKITKLSSINDFTLSLLNEIIIKESGKIYLSERFYGTKIKCISDELGNIKKILYKGRKVTEADILLNSKISKIISVINSAEGIKYGKNEEFYFYCTDHYDVYYEGKTKIRVFNCIVDSVIVNYSGEEFKSKKVLINFLKSVWKKSIFPLRCDELFLNVGRKKISITIKEEEKENTVVDFSYYIAEKNIINEFYNVIKMNENSFYNDEIDLMSRKIKLIARFCVEMSHEFNDQNLDSICKAFKKNINYSKIPVNINDKNKNLVFCFLVNMFIKNNMVRCTNSLITDSDKVKYDYIQEKLKNSYKEMFIKF